MTTIALAAAGEMGAAIGRRIVDSGGDALVNLEGRSSASTDRARLAGIECVDAHDIIERASIYLSIVPPAAAERVADQFLTASSRAARIPTFIDCNAIAPVTLNRIAARFADAGLSFGDGAIIGGPPKHGGRGPRLCLSGNVSEEAFKLRDVGLNVRLISDVPGDASALKMSYAGITKGLQALASGIMVGANDAGVLDLLATEMRDSLPGLFDFLKATLPRMPRKAGRWEQEMLEIATFLKSEDGVSDMFVGAAHHYRQIAIDQTAPSPVIKDIIERVFDQTSVT